MKYLILLLLPLISLPAHPDSDPVQTCRDEHAADPQSHIACLEAALLDLREKDAGRDAAGGAAAPADASRDEEPTGLGAEQLRAAPSPEEAAIDSVRVRIVRSRYDANGKGTFLMEDGQIWGETMAAPKRWRLKSDRQYEARIERGAVGGYRLHVDGIRGMMTVRRVQ